MANRNGFMVVLLTIILIVGAGIPITQSVIDTNNLTGITATVVGFIPVFLGLGALGLSASFM